MTEKSIIDVIEGHIHELEKEVEFFEKQHQTHNHQDVWLKFLADILNDKNPKRENWQ